MRLHGKLGMMIIMASILFLLVGCAPTTGTEVEEAAESTETAVEADVAEVAVMEDEEEETEAEQEEPVEEQEEPEEQEASPTTEAAATESTTPEPTPEPIPEPTPEPAPEPTPEPTPEEAPAATGFKDGSFTGSGQGYDGGITRVRVNVSGGKIQTIEVVSHEDTPPIAEGAFPTVTQSIIASQSVEVDTVSGATFSSRGLIQAVKNALQ